jgi:hypothetical protein
MATSTLSPQPVPNPPEASTGVPPSLQSAPSVLDEVRAAQSHLRTRLAGALTKPPPNTPPSLLPTVPLIDLRPSRLPPRRRSSYPRSLPYHRLFPDQQPRHHLFRHIRHPGPSGTLLPRPNPDAKGRAAYPPLPALPWVRAG